MIGFDHMAEPPECNEREDEGPAPQLDLASCGYEYNGLKGEWSRVVSSIVRVARRSHKDGRVSAGDRYRETIWRIVEDDTRVSYHRKVKKVLR